MAPDAGLAVKHYDGDAQRMRASIGQNDFMCKQCQQAKKVARTDFWDGPTVISPGAISTASSWRASPPARPEGTCSSSVGNVAFLFGFQRLKPEQQVGVLVGDPCALVECID